MQQPPPQQAAPQYQQPPQYQQQQVLQYRQQQVPQYQQQQAPQYEPVFGQNMAKGSNAYASGSNQNVGNYLTDRPTSRVLAPPGGASSFKLG